jgi:hypothetical protein
MRQRLTRPVTAVAAALAIAGAAAPSASATQEARLRQTADGWALVAPDDTVLFEARGSGARITCLRRATDTGVLRILS